MKNLKKRGLILTNAYTDLPSCRYCAERLKEELNSLGVTVDARRNDCFITYVSNGAEEAKKSGKTPSNAHICGSIVQNGAEDYDFCIYYDKDKYLSQMLEASGLRLFNRHSAIRACDDKMTTAIMLANGGIPVPAAISGLLCYDERAELNEDALDRIAKVLGYPIIVKESYGSLGKGVYKADDRAQLISYAEKLKCRAHLFQQCIEESLGTDYRVIVVGGKVIAAMKRTSLTDFRSNIELGGQGSAITADEELKRLCVKTAEILQLDYCGVDVLKGIDGYFVCEVNSNAFFGGIEKTTGINVARAYAEHIIKEMKYV